MSEQENAGDADASDDPKTGSFREAFDAIWEAGGSAWDSIENPTEYIAAMRGRADADPGD